MAEQGPVLYALAEHSGNLGEKRFLHTPGEARLLRIWPNLPVRSGGVRMKLRGSDLQEAQVNDLLEHLF